MSDFTFAIDAKEARDYINDLLNFGRTFMSNKFFRFNDDSLGQSYAYAAKNLRAAYAPMIDHAESGNVRIIWKGEDNSFQDFIFDFTEVGNDIWLLKIADHY